VLIPNPEYLPICPFHPPSHVHGGAAFVATAEYPELASVAWRRHEEEQSKIIQKLEHTVATNFKGASDLLEFAIERLLIFDAGAKDASGIRMLRNVKASIFNANVNSNIDAALHERAVEAVRTRFARIGA
jgi:hypothetical protein